MNKLISFMAKGPLFDPYSTTYTDPGKVTFKNADKPSFVYSGVVTELKVPLSESSLEGEEPQVRMIDDAIVITTVGKQTRAEALKQWNLFYGISFALSGVTLLTGLGVGGLVLAETLALPYIAPAIACSALAIFFFARGLQAYQMYNDWKDPIDDIKDKRIICGSNNIHDGGFMYALKLDAKNKYLHPDEVQQLWWKTLNAFRGECISVKEASDYKKASFINSFFSPFNPFAKNSITYTFTDQDTITIPTHEIDFIPRSKADSISVQFEKYRAEKDNITAKFKSLRDEVNQNRKTALDENKQNWNNALAPFKLVRNLYINNSLLDRDKALAGPLSVKDLGITKAKDAYNRRIEEIYKEFSHLSDEASVLKRKQLKEEAQKAKDNDIISANNAYKANDIVIEAENRFKNKVATANTLYAIALMPIDQYYGKQEKSINEKADQALTKLKTSENKQKATLVNGVQAMYQAFDTASAPVLYPDLTLDLAELKFTPSAPPADEIIGTPEFFDTAIWTDYMSQVKAEPSAPPLDYDVALIESYVT